jgi:tetratricopeptide (TPR) repeat protein
MDVDTLALVAWCHFRLADYDEAVRCLVDVLSQGKPLTNFQFAQFDLALALMCGGRYGAAWREYERGLNGLKQTSPLRRRGLLHVAITDLNLAVRDQPGLEGVAQFRQARESLKEALAFAKAASAGRSPP